MDSSEFPPRCLAVVEPRCRVHLGELFDQRDSHVALAYEYPGEAFFLISDAAALSGAADPVQLRTHAFEAALDQLALGVDPSRAVLYRQSDIPQSFELMWMLTCLSPGSGAAPSADVAEPLRRMLMAANAVGLRATLIRAASDPGAWLETARAAAGALNATQPGVLPLPLSRPLPEVKLPGLDGGPMGHASGNAVGVFASLEEWVQGVCAREGEGESARAMLLALAGRLSEPLEPAESLPSLATRVLGALWENLAGLRERRAELASRPDDVEDILQTGARRARREFSGTVEALREALGLGRYRRKSRAFQLDVAAKVEEASAPPLLKVARRA